MIYKEFGWSLANNILFFANLLNTVKIENMHVPEIVQLGNTSDVILDCQYSAADERLSVNWYYNRSDSPVYSWSPHTEPKVSGVLEGRLDLSYKSSENTYDERRALHIVKLDPELSGEYTCSIVTDTGESHLTKNMLVFRAEQEFLLEWYHTDDNLIKVKCFARGLYPKPDLTLEYNSVPIRTQQSRAWHSDGMLYNSECTADLVPVSSPNNQNTLTCRLSLPQAGYSAIRETPISIEKSMRFTTYQNDNHLVNKGNKSSRFTLPRVYILFVLLLLVMLILQPN